MGKVTNGKGAEYELEVLMEGDVAARSLRRPGMVREVLNASHSLHSTRS